MVTSKREWATGPVVLVDCDGPVADLISKWMAEYRRRWKHPLYPRDLRQFDWAKQAVCGDRVYGMLQEPGFFRENIRVMPGALAALRRMRIYANVVLVTNTPRSAVADRARWVREHRLPVDDVVIAKDKSAVDDVVIAKDKSAVFGHVRIDDHHENLVGSGAHILFDMPYNRGVTPAGQVERWVRTVGWRETEIAVRLALRQLGYPVPEGRDG